MEIIMNNGYNDYENDSVETEDDEFSEIDTPQETAEPNWVPNGEKVEIVGIKFRKKGKTYYFAPGEFELQEDDRVIVDTSRGQEYGYTAVTNREVSASEIVSPLRSVVRMATDEDTLIHEENLKKEIEAYNNCIALIDQHQLQMKLVDVEFAFDRSKLLFYFSAEGRVDFRDLVRDLASIFHTRIEMRQIGIRDEAKILGGLGICGRPFCCSSFLDDFVQVSVKMAKEQNLSLNSAKISGACGRLMCCLRYEYDTYLKEKAITPKVGERVMSPDGPGVVADSNPLTGIVKVKLDLLPEDAEHSVFLRDDLVSEDEYTGEILTRTEIPERHRRNDGEKTVFGMMENTIIGLNGDASEDIVDTTEPIDKTEAQLNSSDAQAVKEDRKNRRQGNRKNDVRKETDRESGEKFEDETEAMVSLKKLGKRDQSRKPGTKGEKTQQRFPGKGGTSGKQPRRDKNAARRAENAEGAETDYGYRDTAENTEKKKRRRPFNRGFKKNRRSSESDSGESS